MAQRNNNGRTRTLSFADDTTFEPRTKLGSVSTNYKNRLYFHRNNVSVGSHNNSDVSRSYINLSRSRGFSFLSDITETSRVSQLYESRISEIDEETEIENTKLIKHAYFKNIFCCNIAFFLLFSSFVGLSIVQNSINGSLGSISLCLIFVVTIISCMVISPLSIRFLGYKNTMVACFVAFAIWEISNFYPHLGTFIPSSVICGVGNGAIWASQATYFSQQNILYAKVTEEPVQLVMTKSFGIFFCFLLSGTSFGCLLTSLVLTLDFSNNNNTSSQPPGGPLPHCGANFCPRKDEIGGYDITRHTSSPSVFHNNSPPEQSRVYYMVGIHSAITIVGLLVMILLVEDICEDFNSDKSMWSQAWGSVKASARQLKRKRQLLLTPLNIFTGMSKSFMLADITQAFIGCALGVDMIGYGSVLYGLVSCASAISSGFIIKRTGRIPIFVAATIVSIVNCTFLLLWIPNTTKIPVFYVIPALWALPDGIFISQMNSLYGCIFHDNAQGAFASFRLWEGIGLVTGYIFNYFICVRNKIYILLVLLTFGMIGYFITENRQTKIDKNKASLQASMDHLTLSFSHGGQNTQDSFNTSGVVAHWSRTSQGDRYPNILGLNTTRESLNGQPQIRYSVYESNV